MSRYRIYLLDGLDHVRQAIDVEAESDEAAAAQTAHLAVRWTIELWKLDRFHCRFEPLGQTTAAADTPRTRGRPADGDLAGDARGL